MRGWGWWYKQRQAHLHVEVFAKVLLPIQGGLYLRVWGAMWMREAVADRDQVREEDSAPRQQVQGEG